MSWGEWVDGWMVGETLRFRLRVDVWCNGRMFFWVMEWDGNEDVELLVLLCQVGLSEERSFVCVLKLWLPDWSGNAERGRLGRD